MQVHIEYTDTFGGEANYSWVNRQTINMPDSLGNRAIMRRAKRAVGLTGVRGTTYNHGDMIEFKPHRSCTVMFITFEPID